SRQAGDRALRSFALRKAVESFRHAIGGLQQIGENRETLIQVVDLHLRMRDALWPLGRLEEMLQVLRDGDALAARAGDPRRRGWIACYPAQYFWSIGENERALDAGERARPIALSLEDLALTAETNFYIGITRLALGQCRKAVDILKSTAPIL